MYKFNSDKKPTGRAMDGMLSSKPRNPKVDPVMRGSQPRLDDFKRPDGFHSQQTTRLNTSGGIQASPQTTSTKVRPQANLSGGRHASVVSRQNRRKSHKARTVFKIFARTSLVVLVLVLALGGFVFGKAWWNTNKVFKGGAEGALALTKDIDPSLLKGEGDGRVNILLLGYGGAGHEGADLTDSIMIASIDPINKETALLSIPRDLWVKPDGLWGMKINAVYSSAKQQALVKKPKDIDAAKQAGEAAIEQTLESYLGVPLHYYAMIDFTAFKQAVDAVGGITVDVKEDLVDYSVAWENVNKSPIIAKKGQQQMDGKVALLFARSRYGSARGDFDRADRQRQVIVAIKDKILSVGTFSNPVKVTQLLDTFGSRVVTNLSISEIMRIYDIGKDIPSSKIISLSLADPEKPLVMTGNVGGQSIVQPKAGLNNFDEIKAYVRLQLKDGYVKSENASIIVLNASGKTGAAKARADELKSYGYNVIQVADIGTPGVVGTQLVDQTKGVKKYTKNYLEKRLTTTSVISVKSLDLTPYSADFILVIGE